MSGEVLLELGKEDLDYMEIKPLGHRKMLLKGVANLREQAGLAPIGGGAPAPAPAPASYATGTSTQASGEASGPATTRVHWSQVQGPKPGGAASQSGASNADGMLDEAKEHEEFKAALQEWRGKKGPIRLVREYAGESAEDSSGGQSGGGAMWQNPADAGKAALMYGLTGGDDGAPTKAKTGTMSALLSLSAPRAPGAESQPAAASVGAAASAGTGTGTGAGTASLLDGQYDEAAEQQRF